MADEMEEMVSSVGHDGRFTVNFHRDAQLLAAWCRRFENTLISTKKQHKHHRHIHDSATQEDDQRVPRLNIAIHIVGSRGDVQPFIPIAQLLIGEPYNYRVRICTHPIFKDFIESQGIEFFSIGGDPEALMAYMVKNPGLLPSRKSVKAGEIGRRREEMWTIINGAWRSCIEAGNGMGDRVKSANVRAADDLFLADAIIANPPSMAHIHCAEKLRIPLHMVFTMPWSATEYLPHPLAAMNYGHDDTKTANYLSFIKMELLTWEGLGDLINKFRDQKLGLDPISPMWGFQLLSRLRVPYTYLWSKALIPKPADWGSHIDVTGFSFLPLAESYTPPSDLLDFLGKGPPPIYIGFGSIVVDDPAALTQLLFDAIAIAGVRAIVSRGWGGVGGNGGGENIPENIYLIGNCPHDWLFQRVSVVVHHGGAGTTAAGIAAGCPTVVVPFFGDQFFWGWMLSRAGAGPEPVPFKEMTAKTLAASIAFCQRPETRVAAGELAQQIAKENGAADTARDFNQRLNTGHFRCELCPTRLAAWKHKRTGIRLSGFAVACLADKGIFEPTDFKLLQRKTWYVDEGAEHPIIGAAAALTSLIAAIATATSDYSRALKLRHQCSGPSEKVTSTSSAPPQPPPVETSGGQHADSGAAAVHKVPSHNGLLKSFLPENAFAPTEMETLALKMAKKSIHIVDPTSHAKPTPTFHGKQKSAWRAWEKGRFGRSWYIARSTGRFAGDVGKAGLKAPVALFFNVANGFHNYPSYGYAAVDVRRRDEITGLGSGLKTAGKEFVLGFWTAFSGVALEPVQTVRDEGPKGLGKGLWRGAKGCVSNIGAAAFGVPGYTLKGIERECSKHHLTKLKAEVILIRLRQGLHDFRRAMPEEREEVIEKWNTLVSS